MLLDRDIVLIRSRSAVHVTCVHGLTALRQLHKTILVGCTICVLKICNTCVTCLSHGGPTVDAKCCVQGQDPAGLFQAVWQEQGDESDDLQRARKASEGKPCMAVYSVCMLTDMSYIRIIHILSSGAA